MLGLLKRDGKVAAMMIPEAKTDTLLPIIRDRVKSNSVGYTDSFRSYNALDVSEFKHYRISHSELFADKQNHINGIENFWNQAKRNLRKFNGIPRAQFHLYLKECEWRFNHGNETTIKTFETMGKTLFELVIWVSRKLIWPASYMS